MPLRIIKFCHTEVYTHTIENISRDTDDMMITMGLIYRNHDRQQACLYEKFHNVEAMNDRYSELKKLLEPQ